MKKVWAALSFMIASVVVSDVCAQAYPMQYYNYPQGYGNYYNRGGNIPQNYGNYYNQSANPQNRTAYYTTPRPSYVPPQYTASTYKYHAPQDTVKNSIYDGRFTMGIDYVVGFASFKDTKFEVEAILPGDDPFVSGTRDFDRTTNALQFNVGWRIFKKFGIEAFYTQSLDQKRISTTSSYSNYPEFARGEYTIYYRGYGLDLLGYYPFNDFIEFIASIGVGKYDAEAKVKYSAYTDNTHNYLRSNEKTFEESNMAYRIGGGLQVWLSRHIALRVMGRWTATGGEFLNYITEINAGIRYHFDK